MSDLGETVREKYGEAARRVRSGQRGSCGCDPVSSNLYEAPETMGLPGGGVPASPG